MAFNSPAEIQTFVALKTALADLGYAISQKARVLDAARAASNNPAITPPGATLGDVIVRGLRDAAGPFDQHHPWLRPGDWSFAFRSHFDFLVHAPVWDSGPLEPLFAVEFDDESHKSQDARRRDCAKNRLCLASGLPLVRIDSTFLHRREHLTLVEWVAELWAAYRCEMPGLLAERDAEVDAMSAAERSAHGQSLLSERPDLDVELIFSLTHPFPPIGRVAKLSRRSWNLAFDAHRNSRS